MIALRILSKDEINHYSYKHGQILETFDGESKKVPAHRGVTYVPTKAFGADMDDGGTSVAEALTPFLEKFDMSEKGAALLYEACASDKGGWIMPQTAGSDAALWGQAVFHAIWGSYTEDLSLLAWMTSQKKWTTRKEFGGLMEKLGTSKGTISITIPQLIYSSKLASANITDRMTEHNEQVSAYPVWSGKVTRPYSQDLLEAIKSTGVSQKTVGKDILSLSMDLMKILEEELKHAEENSSPRMGTVEWRTVAGATHKKDVDGNVVTAPILTNKFFLSRN